VEAPQRRKGRTILLSEFPKNIPTKLSFLNKTILNIFTLSNY
jgi:hypothetical protein